MKSRAPHSHIDQQPPGLRHLFVADNRLYVDRTIMSMLKHERVECAIAHDDHNNEEILFDFSSPDYPIERLFSNTVAWFDFSPKLESIVFEGPSCECDRDYPDSLHEMVHMLVARWDKDGSTLQSFKIHGSEIRVFDEHPTVKRIRRSPRYSSPEWVVDL